MSSNVSYSVSIQTVAPETLGCGALVVMSTAGPVNLTSWTCSVPRWVLTLMQGMSVPSLWFR